MAFGCIVTGIQHRVTKNGKPFGILELEDYKDSQEFFLFGEDYLKFRHFLVQGTFLFVKGRVRERKYREGEFEFNIQSVELLSDIRSKMAKSITINMALSNLDEETLEKLTEILNANKGHGSCSVKFEVIDHAEKAVIELPSRSLKVDVTNELIGSLEEMQTLNYKLN